MSQFDVQAVFVPTKGGGYGTVADLDHYETVRPGNHNAWAVFQGDQIRYAFLIDDRLGDQDQKQNALRTLEWCRKREEKKK